jgi:DNA-binding NtrC family response regulator
MVRGHDPRNQPRVAVTTASKKNAEPRSCVVIVDDERSYVDLMAQMLAENLECDVHPFTRPKDALKRLPDLGATVVVTDYFMPDMDGVEFIRRASMIVPKAAFIMISGHNLEPIEHELARLKSLKLRLQKPFGWRPLAAAVVEVWPGNNAPTFQP